MSFKEFVEKINTQHPDGSSLPIELTHFQKNVAKNLLSERFVSISKGSVRQVGLSTIINFYLLYMCIFSDRKVAFVGDIYEFSRLNDILMLNNKFFSSLLKTFKLTKTTTKTSIKINNSSITFISRNNNINRARGKTFDVIFVSQQNQQETRLFQDIMMCVNFQDEKSKIIYSIEGNENMLDHNFCNMFYDINVLQRKMLVEKTKKVTSIFNSINNIF